MKNLKLVLLLLKIAILPNILNAQSHHVWPTDENFKSFGRVIDVLEIEKDVLLLQTLDLNTSYKVNEVRLNLLNLTNDVKSNYTSYVSTNQFPSGMILLKDKSIVVNTSGQEFELRNLTFSSSDFALNAKGTIKGQFPSFPGGIASFKSGAYIVSASFLYPNKEKNSNLLLKKNVDKPFGSSINVNNNENTIEMLMKPKMLTYMYNPISEAKDTSSHVLGFQVITSNEEKILNYSVSLSKTDPNPNKIIAYSKELIEEWRLEFSGDLDFGIRPIAAGPKNFWYLSGFQAQGKGITNSLVQMYDGKNATDSKVSLNAFEVNGSLLLQNGDLCVYGFKTAPHPQAPEVILTSPLFYILDGKSLAIKKTWELSESDEPMKKLSELYGQTVYLAGKFYSATQLSDGSLVFGGHLISPIALVDQTKSGQLTFNYVYKTSENYLK